LSFLNSKIYFIIGLNKIKITKGGTKRGINLNLKSQNFKKQKI